MNLFTSSSRSFVIFFLAIFAIGIAGFIAGSEMIIRRVALPQDAFEVYQQRFRNAGAKTAAFGDSHVADGLISDERIVNLGYAGETLPIMLTKAEAYVNSGRAKRVILQLSPEQFAIYRAERQDNDLLQELFGNGEPWLQLLRPHFRRYLLAYWSAFLKNPSRVIAEKKSPAENVLSYAERPAAERRKEAEIRAQLHAPMAGGPIVSRLFDQFAQALDRFRQHGVAICIIEYPVSSYYRAAASDIATFGELRRRYQKLATEKNVRLIDLTDALPDAAFNDPDHIAPAYRDRATTLVLSRCFDER